MPSSSEAEERQRQIVELDALVALDAAEALRLARLLWEECPDPLTPNFADMIGQRDAAQQRHRASKARLEELKAQLSEKRSTD